MRYLLLVVCIAFMAFAGVLLAGWRPPYRYNPWAPMDLRAPPGIFTSFRLYRLNEHPVQCLDALAASGAGYERVPNRSDGNGCGWHNAVLLRGTGFALLARPTVVACPLAASLVLLDRNVLQPTAKTMFDSRVAMLDHVGSYSCRNIEGDDRLSSHASARALGDRL